MPGGKSAAGHIGYNPPARKGYALVNIKLRKTADIFGVGIASVRTGEVGYVNRLFQYAHAGSAGGVVANGVYYVAVRHPELFPNVNRPRCGMPKRRGLHGVPVKLNAAPLYNCKLFFAGHTLAYIVNKPRKARLVRVCAVFFRQKRRPLRNIQRMFVAALLHQRSQKAFYFFFAVKAVFFCVHHEAAASLTG